MRGAGQWTLDHRRSLRCRRKRKKRQRQRKKESKRHFKASPDRQVGNDSKTGRKKAANMTNNSVVFKLQVL